MARTVVASGSIAYDEQRAVRPGGTPVQPIAFFAPAVGLNTSLPPSRLSPEAAAGMKNLVLQRGRLESRYALTQVGSAFGESIVWVGDVVPKSGRPLLLAITTRYLYYFDAVSQTWIRVDGLSLNGGATDVPSVTMFGDKVLFSNGVDPVASFDVITRQANFLSGAPAARWLTTFNNRVVAANVVDQTGVRPSRVRWTAKNDETKWADTDLGAGFEDAAPSPLLTFDTAQAIVPVTETVALLFRSRSTWTMSATGFVDAPFSFNLLFQEFGTNSPYSLVVTPAGVIGYFRDNWYIVATGGVTPIGDPVVDRLAREMPSTLVGMFDNLRQEYRVLIPGAVLRYSLRDKGWTQDEYTEGALTYIARSSGVAVGGTTIDQLAGAIDDLVGTIGTLGISQASLSTRAYAATSTTVYQEDPGAFADGEIVTGWILPATPLHTVSVNEVQIEYTSTEPKTFTVYTSVDGQTWALYGTASGPASGVVSIRKTLSEQQLQFKVATTGRVALLGVYVFAIPGGLRKP